MSSIINALTSSGGIALSGDTSGQLQLQTNNGTPAVTIDTSQNVGIGTTTPSYTNSGRICMTINGATDSVWTMNYGGTVGLYAQAQASDSRLFTTGSLPLLLGTGSAERMRVDQYGNVGINNTSPATYGTLVVTRTSSPSAATFIGNASLTGSAPTYKGSIRLIDNPSSSTTSDGGIEFLTSNYSAGYGWKMASIDSSGVQLTFATRQNSASWTETMRLDTSGNLLINKTSAGSYQKLCILYTSGVDGASMQHPDASGATNPAQLNFLNGAGTRVGYIASNGTATTYSTSSDYRLKENVAQMTGALNKVAQLKPVTYTWKDGGASQGFIAHELQSIIPEAVVGEKDAIDAEGNPVYQGIDTSFLVATLTAAIQELNAKFEEYKASHP